MSIEVKVPVLPESVSDATIAAWHKKAGDTVRRDENLLDLETDKVVLEVPSPVDGVLKELKFQAGDTVTSQQVVAIIEEGAVAAAPAPAAAPASAGTVDLSKIAVGMSQAQVNDLLGPPTAQTQRMTGKQWQPFNFGAKDLQRMMYLYKGVGRVEFSLKSAYEGVFRVVAVTPDPKETGYP